MKKYATLSNWTAFSTRDLWAARSSMLHAYSPLGDHTDKGLAKPIFYYAWPERPEDMRERLARRGYGNFLLVDVAHIKAIAIDVFNSMWMRVERDAGFAARVERNAEHLVRDAQQMALEDALIVLEQHSSAGSESVRFFVCEPVALNRSFAADHEPLFEL